MCQQLVVTTMNIFAHIVKDHGFELLFGINNNGTNSRVFEQINTPRQVFKCNIDIILPWNQKAGSVLHQTSHFKISRSLDGARSVFWDFKPLWNWAVVHIPKRHVNFTPNFAFSRLCDISQEDELSDLETAPWFIPFVLQVMYLKCLVISIITFLCYVFKSSSISRTLVGNEIVDNSDVFGASPVGAAPTTSSFSTQHLISMDWAKTTAKRMQETFKLWDLVRLILEVLRYTT